MSAGVNRSPISPTAHGVLANAPALILESQAHGFGHSRRRCIDGFLDDTFDLTRLVAVLDEPGTVAARVATREGG